MKKLREIFAASRHFDIGGKNRKQQSNKSDSRQPAQRRNKQADRTGYFKEATDEHKLTVHAQITGHDLHERFGMHEMHDAGKEKKQSQQVERRSF